ncbi:hypothetical protein COLSTE_00724 [Collinsella stercoris DSM 13279]|uniref:Uncharacterized protein n=1 Tax=Collinsella stercoris DSM 13279 TaxID=445975 RepID=B6G9I3_9ACTN|nr:hypothetical protein COLSTE_00724 [Collinsella stercoris DSM 13279]
MQMASREILSLLNDTKGDREFLRCRRFARKRIETCQRTWTTIEREGTAPEET